MDELHKVHKEIKNKKASRLDKMNAEVWTHFSCNFSNKPDARFLENSRSYN